MSVDKEMIGSLRKENNSLKKKLYVEKDKSQLVKIIIKKKKGFEPNI
jgi:hypothetical protein